LNDEALNSQSAILSFGLNPKKKCDDFKYVETETRNFSDIISDYRPGAFSMTPLGDSIIRGTDIAIERKVKKVVIFSDGADSCGKDPCKELVNANDKLVKANFRMSIKFIGINLGKNDPRFECFRNNKLSNIDIEYTNIGDSFEVQQALQDAANTSGGSISLQTVKSPWGIVFVKGAPATVRFKAEAQTKGVDNKGRDQWLGSYRNQLKGGGYYITTNYPGTKKLEVFVYPDQEKEVYWSDFFKDPKSKLNYSHSTISVLLTPSGQTKESHRVISDIMIEGLIENIAKKDTKIPFGDWVAEPISPPWLKDFGIRPTISIKPQGSSMVNFAEIFDLEWLNNPDAERPWVLAVIAPAAKGGEEIVSGTTTVASTITVSEPVYIPPTQYVEDEKRYYIQPGVLAVPMVKGAKVRWLKPEEAPSSVEQNK
jgi:hypothetical protein